MSVNTAVPSPYQRFAIAHDIAHVLCGHCSLFHCGFADPFVFWLDARQEWEADRAALAILLPGWALRSYGTVEELAAACGVPCELLFRYLGY